MRRASIQELLAEERKRFVSALPPNIEERWQRYTGKIALVLSGGGARGAYEAGVLLAFQDAKLPTHIISSTSIGSINAASYAAHSEGCVGDAESLIQSWSEITPHAVGIDWSRYIFVLAGLTALTAGIGNLVRQLLSEVGFYLHLHDPKLTWVTLAATGAAILGFHDTLPYLGYVLVNLFRRKLWRPDKKKLWNSILSNLLVWGFLWLSLNFAHLHFAASQVLRFDLKNQLLIFSMLLFSIALWWLWRAWFSKISHKFLRVPLRTGLFPNFERTRFLKQRIPTDKFRRSCIRVLMTAADVQTGEARFFSNIGKEELKRDAGVDAVFVDQEVSETDDLLRAIIASSAFPIVYETVPIEQDTWTDGGIVANQPIRPAIRMGATVLFLVLVEPRTQTRPDIKTFLDLGVRAIDILMSHNLRADLRLLDNVNNFCKHYADEIGVRPEEIKLHAGNRSYRYLKSFTINPAKPLQTTLLDFDGRVTEPAIQQGYRDASGTIREFLEYVNNLPRFMAAKEIRLVAQEMRAALSRTL